MRVIARFMNLPVQKLGWERNPDTTLRVYELSKTMGNTPVRKKWRFKKSVHIWVTENQEEKSAHSIIYTYG
jgi:hypothetical protein